jgi:hypothetical protein
MYSCVHVASPAVIYTTVVDVLAWQCYPLFEILWCFAIPRYFGDTAVFDDIMVFRDTTRFNGVLTLLRCWRYCGVWRRSVLAVRRSDVMAAWRCLSLCGIVLL